MKVKELIDILKELDQKSTVYAKTKSPKKYETNTKILCKNLKDVVYNKQAKAVSLSFADSDVISEDEMWTILA